MPSSPATPLAAEPSIAVRIAAALPSLTPIHRRMGEYVLANPFRAATMRIDELANAVDASIATANRFARALGFDGYPALRAALVRGFEATLAPVERLRCAQEREAGARGGELIDASFEQALANFERTRGRLDRANVEAAVDSLLAARRIFIVGMGASAFLAGLMEHGLSVYRDNVQSLALLGGPTDAARRLFSARGDDLVVAIAFPRYVYDTIELTRRARARDHRRARFADRAVRRARAFRARGAPARGDLRGRGARARRGADRRGRASLAALGARGRRSDRIHAAVARGAGRMRRAAAPAAPFQENRPMTSPAIVAIHGGAGTILREAMTADAEAQYRAELAAILAAAQKVLAEGGSALDAVSVAVRMLEDCPLFNAGRGAVYTADGTHELDAAIMDGATLAAGAICCATRVRNPVLAARRVLEASEHVMFAGAGADAFAAAQGLELAPPGYFDTEPRRAQWLKARRAAGTMLDHDAAAFVFGRGGGDGGGNGGGPGARAACAPEPLDPDRKHGTVGAVARDLHGHLAAATSTGGITNKQPGRVGDTPIIGAGCYANDATCAVSATGTGEMFIRLATAYDVSAQIEYRGASLAGAAYDVVMNKLPSIAGRGGIIAVDARGNLAMPFNTEGMYRGYARVGEAPVTAIYREDAA